MTTTLMKKKTKSNNSSALKSKTKSSEKQKVRVVYDVDVDSPKKAKTKTKSTKVAKKVTKSTVKKNVKENKKVKSKKVVDKKPDSVFPDDIVVIRDKNLETSYDSTSTQNSFESSDEPRKVRRRGRNKKDKIYFSKATEEAIIEFNQEEDDVIRNKIYEERIKFSFEKLVENIYNTFKFTYFDCGPLDVQKETVTHLVANIHKFQEGKGKAFSYFSIVAKNYLIFHNNNNYRRFNQHVDISDTPTEDSVCLQSEDEYYKKAQTQEFMKLLINYWEKNITKIFTKQKDLNIAYAVIELFRNCNRIESFNKKTLYLYIREISNCKTQQITKVLNKMKSHQNTIMKNYINNGMI